MLNPKRGKEGPPASLHNSTNLLISKIGIFIHRYKPVEQMDIDLLFGVALKVILDSRLVDLVLS